MLTALPPDRRRVSLDAVEEYLAHGLGGAPSYLGAALERARTGTRGTRYANGSQVAEQHAEELAARFDRARVCKACLDEFRRCRRIDGVVCPTLRRAARLRGVALGEMVVQVLDKRAHRGVLRRGLALADLWTLAAELGVRLRPLPRRHRAQLIFRFFAGATAAGRALEALEDESWLVLEAWLAHYNRGDRNEA
jgi:hypothetical protein